MAQYAWLTIRHKWYVFLACRMTGVPFWQAAVHDLSKFTPMELPAYGRQFFGDQGDQRDFARAWLHHQNVNPHHWEYWVSRSEHGRGRSEADDQGAFEMPEQYVRELVADWIGASLAYTGSPEITDWLKKNLPGMILNRKTVLTIRQVLSEMQDVSELESE
jgi:hypothetical protein